MAGIGPIPYFPDRYESEVFAAEDDWALQRFVKWKSRLKKKENHEKL
jgi:hypothetical protein